MAGIKFLGTAGARFVMIGQLMRPSRIFRLRRCLKRLGVEAQAAYDGMSLVL
ncbi:MAG: hypothetical protein WC315_07330 [Candidatus Omnitrophota bacterium]|jgi:hypothetical protein